MKPDYRGNIRKEENLRRNRDAAYGAFNKDRISKPENKDTIHKREISKLIVDSLEAGKSKAEILVMLVRTYPNSYLRPNFMQYIEHHSTTLEHRREVQARIRIAYAQGKRKEEILEELNAIYPNSPIKRYFEHEVDRYTSTKEITNPFIDSGEER